MNPKICLFPYNSLQPTSGVKCYDEQSKNFFTCFAYCVCACVLNQARTWFMCVHVWVCVFTCVWVCVWFTYSVNVWVLSYLPLVSCLTRHIGCWKAPKAVLHRGSPKGTSHIPRRGISRQGHGVLRVVVQIVVIWEQRRLVKAAVVSGVGHQVRCVLHVPSAGDSRNILDDHASL
jgi:hypothetical protein